MNSVIVWKLGVRWIGLDTLLVHSEFFLAGGACELFDIT